MNAILSPEDMLKTRVWVPVVSTWLIKPELRREYKVNTDPWLHGIAIELLDNEPVAVLGSHTEYYGSDNRPAFRQKVSVIPVDHLEPHQPEPREEPQQLALSGLALMSGTEKLRVVAVETQYGTASRYLVIEYGRLRWTYPIGNVIAWSEE